MVSRTLRFALLGEAIGLCAVVLLYHRIAEVLYGVAKFRTALPGVVVLLVFSVSFLASFWPAWSAVDKDPIDVT
jgi:ABC-type antimicrobial peptide transport system permease subunit